MLFVLRPLVWGRYSEDAGVSHNKDVTNVSDGTTCQSDTTARILSGLLPNPLRSGPSVVGWYHPFSD